MVFQTGLLTDADAADIGWAALPLGDLHGEPARPCWPTSAGQVVLTRPVTAIAPVAGGGFRIGWRGRPGHRRRRGPGRPAEKAAPLLPAGALPEQTVAGWAGLGASPIINVHVIYDRPVHGPAVRGRRRLPVQWVFDRTRSSGMDRPGRQYLAVSRVGRGRVRRHPVAELREQFLPELAGCCPAARGARVHDFFVTRERPATFRPTPGSGALRPKTATAAPGLFLAGAWTDTGWPATMEGAVRSGRRARRAAPTR